MGQHVFNLFEITNLRELRTRYRLVDIGGTYGTDDLADQNLSLLAKRVAYQERAPVALIRRSGQPFLAVPADLELHEKEFQLTPDLVELSPQDEVHELRLAELTRETERIGMSFLAFDLRSPLWKKHGLWSSGSSSFFSKKPANYRDDRREVDVYQGFGYRLVHYGGKLYLSVSLMNKYCDTRWLLDRYKESDLHDLKMRHMLYHTGHRWFTLQLLAVTGKSIGEQRFVFEDKTVRTVFDHTVMMAGSAPPPWIQSLSADSPAISFQYPGNEKKHFAAAALCKLLLSTEHQTASKLHRLSIKSPELRMQETIRILKEHFFGAEFQGVPIRFSGQPLRTRPKFFPVPSVRFGQGKVLEVEMGGKPNSVSLEKLGQARLGHLLDPEGGLAVCDPLGAQYLLAPDTIDRKIVELFQNRQEKTVQQLLHAPYTFQTRVYENNRKRSLKDQVDAILRAVSGDEPISGHGILMLPENGDADLHNYIKKRLHNRIQFQCVCAGKVKRFFRIDAKNGKACYFVPGDQERDFTSYLRLTAMGLLLVNRQWPWVLEHKTHYDAYIGVDVLHNTAAFTFFYEGGKRCFVRLEESKQKEKVPRKKMAAVIYQYLKEDLRDRPGTLRSLVLRRDGRAFNEEWLGFMDAIHKLIAEGILPQDINVGMVEVHKTFSLGLRLMAEDDKGCLVNPRIGSWRDLNDSEGLLCTTGYPFKFDGTVRPLYIRVVRGKLDFSKVLEDTFAMSQLCWPVPNRCMRLSIDLKLCDDLLRATASAADEDEALYGEEETEYGDEADIGVSFSD